MARHDPTHKAHRPEASGQHGAELEAERAELDAEVDELLEVDEPADEEPGDG